MSLKYAILGVLDVGPMTGYQLTQYLETSSRWVWSAPQSQIYPQLKQLAAEGLITGERHVKGSRLNVTTYSITEDGAGELRRWLVESHPVPPQRDAFLLQALFSDLVDPAETEKVFLAHIEELEGLIESWRLHYENLLRLETPLMQERMVRGADNGPSIRTVMSKANVFQGLVRTGEARLAWAKDTLAWMRSSGPGGTVDGPAKLPSAAPERTG